MFEFRGILPTIHKIPEGDISAVISAYRAAVDTKATDAWLRPYAVNSLIYLSRDEVLRRIKESPAELL